MAKHNNWADVGVDSKWEAGLIDLFQAKQIPAKYHETVLDYTVPSTTHKYTPDWVMPIGDQVLYIEAKGRFRELSESKKYIHVRDSLKENEELIFIFMNPRTPMPNAKRRKDGTKRTHKDWAVENGFRWFSVQSFILEFGGKDEN